MARKKIKKFLEKAAPLLAVAGLGKAFMNARNRKNQMKDFLATEGGDLSDMSGMIDEFGVAPKKGRGSILADPRINRMDLSEVDLDFVAPSTEQYRNMDMGLGPFAAKDGGRARKTKGFAKKKKQAKKMRKK